MQNSTDECAEPGLRERKQLARRIAIQRAAIELCESHGYDGVTVEMIAERVGVSMRTFYNYFPSREAAFLGEGKPMPTEAQVEAFVARDDVSDVEAFAVMMADAWAQHEPDRELFIMRRRLIDAVPELTALNFARIGEARSQYAALVAQRLTVRYPELSLDDVERESALTVAVAMGAIQTVAKTWLKGPADETSALEGLVHDLFPRLRRLTQAPQPQ